MTKRPPLSLVTPEQIKYNAHHLANSTWAGLIWRSARSLCLTCPRCPRLHPGYSSFGPQALSSLQAAPTAAIEKAKQELKVPLVSPVAQFPAGQVSSFGRQSLSTRSSSKRALLRTRGKVNPIPRQWSDVGPAAYMPPSTCVAAACWSVVGAGPRSPPHDSRPTAGLATAVPRQRCLPTWHTPQGVDVVCARHQGHGARRLRLALASRHSSSGSRAYPPMPPRHHADDAASRRRTHCTTRQHVGPQPDAGVPCTWNLPHREHDRPGTASAAQPRKQRGAARRPGTSGGVGGGAGAGGGEGAPQTLSEWLESYGKPTKGTMFQHMETRRPRLTRWVVTCRASCPLVVAQGWLVDWSPHVCGAGCAVLWRRQGLEYGKTEDQE